MRAGGWESGRDLPTPAGSGRIGLEQESSIYTDLECLQGVGAKVV